VTFTRPKVNEANPYFRCLPFGSSDQPEAFDSIAYASPIAYCIALYTHNTVTKRCEILKKAPAEVRWELVDTGTNLCRWGTIQRRRTCRDSDDVMFNVQ